MTTIKPLEFFIQWHLTEQCNLACSHCYQSGRTPGELSLSEIRETAAEAAGMIRAWSEAYGIAFKPSMNITGGEPFLRPDLFPILEEAKEQGFEVYLLTNGTLVDRPRARMLADLGVDGVQVSMEGPEYIHDKIRGRGGFAAAAAGVAHLVENGLSVTLNVTLSALNCDQAAALIAFGSHAGVRRIGFSRLVPTGNASSLTGEMISREKLRHIYASLLSLEAGELSIITGDPVARLLEEDSIADRGDRAVSGCAAAVSGLTISANGELFPCRRLPVSLGNVRNDALREVWATSPVLEAIRDRKRYRGKCGRCSRWAECRGCRAIAYASSRLQGQEDFLADDPQCFLEQTAGVQQRESGVGTAGSHPAVSGGDTS